jgi:hypothetical protein
VAGLSSAKALIRIDIRNTQKTLSLIVLMSYGPLYFLAKPKEPIRKDKAPKEVELTKDQERPS